MHAYLLITKNKKLRTEDIQTFINVKDYDLVKESIFKINDVKRLIKETNLKFKIKTVYLIENFDESSVEAQNAFLKRLEEPQENLIFLLTASSQEKLIPTILSRVQIVASSMQQVASIYSNEFFKLDLNSKFLEIDKIKTRDEAKEFCLNLLLLSKNNENYFKYLDPVNKCLYALESNGNATLQLTNMLVLLNKIG